eukprot:PLAT13898.1.p1 GENE.PLAT13898.1~~PLAT13898.1.p1  ORF type:complete len:233 (+),score=102.18 PLAT13898.1:14-712(+)
MCKNCCAASRHALLIFFSAALVLVGLGEAALGAFISSQERTLSILSGSLLGSGLLVALLMVWQLCSGHNSPCFLVFFVILMSLVVLAQVGAICAFLIPKTRAELLTYLHPPADVVKTIQSNIQVAGYFLLGMVGVELLTIWSAWGHRSHLLREARRDSEAKEEEDLERGLLDKRRKKVELYGSAAPKHAEASDKMRNKYGHLYDKYNIKTPEQRAIEREAAEKESEKKKGWW